MCEHTHTRTHTHTHASTHLQHRGGEVRESAASDLPAGAVFAAGIVAENDGHFVERVGGVGLGGGLQIGPAFVAGKA